MNKKLRTIILGLAVITTSTTFVMCGNGYTSKGNNENQVANLENSDHKEGFTYKYDNGKDVVDVKVTESPNRAVTLSQFMTEMLLSLDLGDRMVGTALLDNPILPEYKDAYDKIPVLKITEGHNISKESFSALEPDFVSGWDMSISNESTGTAKELVDEGVYPFVAKSLNGDATIETVYEDYTTLGNIFNVQDKANEVVNNMKSSVNKVQENIKNVKEEERPKVMVYDSGEKEAMVVGSGLPNNLITLAGGNNVFGDLNKAYEMVSFESIVDKNPDVIIVTDYLAGDPVEKKIEFLKNHPALKDVNAIKNNKIYVVELADISPGIRNSKVVEKMNKMFY
ncbi:ABC transporter substrate-binding protein [Clostridium perfringens]|nr:ABC transporter substrate-binding protein [Clostridium perfringens]MDK0712612.1 ABC transporter substrate-binding protein [Clostridium perfringens]